MNPFQASPEEYPHLYPPKRSRYINMNGSLGISANSGPTLLDSRSVGSNEEGWITVLTLNGNFVANYFKIQINGIDVPDYNWITAPYADNSQVMIYLPPGCTVSIWALPQGSPPPATSVRWRAYGWIYSKAKKG